MRVSQKPSLLEFYGYVYFFGGFLAGPAFNFKEYCSFIDLSVFKSAPQGKQPSSFFPALRTFVFSLALAAVVLVGNLYNLNLSFCRQEKFYTYSFFEK
jgi:lysophospholipid acyltransferase